MQPNLLGIKLREIREINKFGTLKTFAPKLGVSNNTLATYELGTVLPDVDFLIKFCEETDADFNELLDLRIQASPAFANEADVHKASKYLLQSAASDLQTAANFEEMLVDFDPQDQVRKLTANQPRIKYLSEDTIYIEHYTDVRAAAGSGQVTPTDQTIIQVAVNAADWRNYVGLNHKHVKIITVYGDSMKPTFAHGDQVLVDTACLAFIDDGVYAIQQGDLLRVKRIKLRLDGSIEVKSDNSHGFANDIYKAEEAADFKIYGRVLPFKFGKIDL